MPKSLVRWGKSSWNINDFDEHRSYGDEGRQPFRERTYGRNCQSQKLFLNLGSYAE